MPAATLEALQRQIDQRERELQKLRADLESRQSHLAELSRRKEELRRQLQQIEAQIAGLSVAGPTGKKGRGADLPPTARSDAPGAGQAGLREQIVAMLRDQGKPMTASQLAEEAQRRGYQVSGRDPASTIKDRLKTMRNQGLVRKARGRRGFALAAAANGARTEQHKPGVGAAKAAPRAAMHLGKRQAAKASRNGPSVSAKAKGTKLAQPGKQPPLRVVLTNILAKSRRPMSGSELAEQALATGYQTSSQKFADNVWAVVNQMDNIEHVPGKGYRLKKG